MSLTTIQDFRRRYPIRPNDDAFILGSGSYGKVVKVEDQVETEWVAVKISEFKGDDSKSLQAEIQLARKIPRHPNIARYDECYRFETDTNVCDFAIMRYYPDGNLAMLMRQTALTLAQKEELVRGILVGLQHLHRQRIVHRDFKPANILISRDNQGRLVPKIADFGLSRLVQEDEIDSSDFDLSDGRGTPSYKAPEQITGGKVSFNLDLWAFGVILFELFTGEKPFMASHKTGSEHVMKLEIEKKIVNVVIPDRVRDVPEPYQTLIRRCLVKDVRKRARKEEELLDLLDGLPALLDEAGRLMQDQKFEEAIARYETILAHRDNHPKAIQGLKDAQELARNREQGIATLVPEADALFSRRAYAEARAVYETVLKTEPKNAHAKRQIAACNAAIHQQTVDKLWQEAERLMGLGELQSAKARYGELLRVDPRHFLAHTRLDDVEKAERQHKLNALLTEADACFAQTKYDKAKPVYEAVLALESQNATAKRQLERIAKTLRQQRIDERLSGAQKLVSKKQYAQAKAAFEQVLAEDARNEIARQGVATCVAALTPSPAPEPELTDIYSIQFPEESTDVFTPGPVVSAKPNQAEPKPVPVAQPKAIPEPARTPFVIRPLYVWVSGLALVLSLGGYFLVNRGPKIVNKSPETVTPGPTIGDTKPPPVTVNTSRVSTPVGATEPPIGSPLTPTTELSTAGLEKYESLLRQATIALNANDLAKAKDYLNQARNLNRKGQEVRKLEIDIQRLEKEQTDKLKDEQTGEIDKKPVINDPPPTLPPSGTGKEGTDVKPVDLPNPKALQVQYDELINQGTKAINPGNRKAVAIGYFKQAQQFAKTNAVETAEASKLYGIYVSKGDRIFQGEDLEGAKAWYQVAQALRDTEEIQRKIRACTLKQ